MSSPGSAGGGRARAKSRDAHDPHGSTPRPVDPPSGSGDDLVWPPPEEELDSFDYVVVGDVPVTTVPADGTELTVAEAAGPIPPLLETDDRIVERRRATSDVGGPVRMRGADRRRHCLVHAARDATRLTLVVHGVPRDAACSSTRAASPRVRTAIGCCRQRRGDDPRQRSRGRAVAADTGAQRHACDIRCGSSATGVAIGRREPAWGRCAARARGDSGGRDTAERGARGSVRRGIGPRPGRRRRTIYGSPPWSGSGSHDRGRTHRA